MKRTEIGVIPDDWEYIPISKVVLKTLQRDPSKMPDEEIKYVDVSGVNNELFQIKEYTVLKGKDAPSRARKVIEADDILFATVRPTLKRVAIVESDLHKELCSTGYCVLKANSSRVDYRFLYYYLLTGFYINEIAQLQRGASYPAVRDSDVKGIKMPLPPLPEQQSISRILTLIQSAIQKQEQIIRTTTELKNALMQKLFTEGLNYDFEGLNDDHDSLKNKKSRQSGKSSKSGFRQLKQTEIGLIPESWEVVELGRCLLKTKTKNPESQPDKEFKYLDVSGVSNDFFTVKEYSLLKGKEAPSRARKEIHLNDIVFATVRPTLKRIAIIPAELNNEICSTGYCVLKCDKEKLDFGYLYFYLQTKDVIDRMAKLQRGASYPAVRDSDVKDSLVPKPSLEEQKQISKTLFVLDNKIQHHQSKKQTLTALFRSMLHQLMTGQIRVLNYDVND